MTSNPDAVRADFRVGEVFASVAALKHEIARYFAHRKTGFKYKTNNKKRLAVQCTEHRECPFELKARCISGTEAAEITAFNCEHGLVHVVTGVDRKRAPHRVRSTLIVPIAGAVLESAERSVKSSQIAKRARLEGRIKISRRQAWRAKRAVIDASDGEGKDSYKFFKDWLSKMEGSNPGSVTRHEQTDGHFSRACIVYGVFNKLFPSMLPVIALDACHLKSKDEGTLYVASMLTGNFDVIIAGIAISNVEKRETKEGWLRFLDCLTEAIPVILERPCLVVVSDRDKGLLPAVRAKISNGHHSYCSVHIKRNVIATFHTGLDGLIHKIAKEPLAGAVDDFFSELRSSHPPIASYLEGIDKASWITAHFPVPRFGIVTSNAAESMNSWIEEDRLSAHLAVFIGISRKIGSRLHTLFDQYSQAKDKDLVPRIVNVLAKSMDSALRREVLPYGMAGSELVFEVKRLSCQGFRVVNLSDKTCSCGLWTELQYPCVHAQAVLLELKRDAVEFVNPVFLAKTCAHAVQGTITPVDVTTCAKDDTALAPVVVTKRGRRRVNRFQGADDPSGSRTSVPARENTTAVDDDRGDDERDERTSEGHQEESGGCSEGHQEESGGCSDEGFEPAPTDMSTPLVTGIKCSLCRLHGHNKRTCPSQLRVKLPDYEEDARDLSKWQFVEGIWYPENMFDLEFE